MWLSDSANSIATNNDNYARWRAKLIAITTGKYAWVMEQIQLQQTMAIVLEPKSKINCNNHPNMPEWLSHISCNDCWQVCQSDWVKNAKMGNNQAKQGQCAPMADSKKAALTSEMLLDCPGMKWLFATTKIMGILSLFSPNNQPVLVNQQMFQWNNSRLYTKRTFFLLQQSTGYVDQQICQLTTLWLHWKNFTLLSQQSISSINHKCVFWHFLTPYEGNSYLLPLATTSTGNVDQQLCWLTLSWLKGEPFSFLLQQSIDNVNQQMCHSTTSQLDTKRTPFSYLSWQESTSSIDPQKCQFNGMVQLLSSESVLHWCISNSRIAGSMAICSGMGSPWKTWSPKGVKLSNPRRSARGGTVYGVPCACQKWLQLCSSSSFSISSISLICR